MEHQTSRAALETKIGRAETRLQRMRVTAAASTPGVKDRMLAEIATQERDLKRDRDLLALRGFDLVNPQTGETR